MKVLTEAEKIELKKLYTERVNLILLQCTSHGRFLFRYRYNSQIEDYSMEKLEEAIKYLEKIRIKGIYFMKTIFI